MLQTIGLVAALTFTASPAGAVGDVDEGGFIGIQFKESKDPKGAEVTELIKDAPAEKAGIKAGDIIIKIDDADFDSLEAFAKYVRSKKPGDKIAFIVRRDDKEESIKITVGKKPDEV